jgi:hypothetical protein
MSTIRPLERSDLTTVANLLVRTFQGRQDDASPEMANYLGHLLLDQPDKDPDIHSFVHEQEKGYITGFIGVFTQRMSLGGRTLRAAIGNSLAVERNAVDPMAGARLCRSFFQGPQDITISDRSNATSVGLWRSMGGDVLPLYSLDWLRVLRPMEAATFTLRRRLRLIGPTLPLVRGLDHVAAHLARRRGHDIPETPQPPLRPKGLTRKDADVETLAPAIRALVAEDLLHPVWSDAGIAAVLAQAGQKRELGQTVMQVVEDASGQSVGAYIYYLPPHGLAQVLHVFSKQAMIGPVLDLLFLDAYERGAAAIGGRAQPRLIEALMDRRARFSSAYRCVFRARDAEVMAAVQNGKAVIGGFVGEFWTRLNGDGLR